ncbi:MAG: hypothetical protein ABI912_00090 [Actinomycetota bacterium]
MLTAVAGLFALITCVVIGHWYLTRVDELGRQVAFPKLWVALLVVLSLFAATPGVLRARLENRLSGVASTLSGRRVRVRCQAFGAAFVDAGGELGYVKWKQDGTPVSWTLIKRNQCNDLSGYLDSGKHDTNFKRMLAVHILTHESMHLASITNEAAAECAAVQRDARTARLLGASAVDARALAAQYYATVYPRMPDAYRSADCKAGGVLDEGLEDAPWLAA